MKKLLRALAILLLSVPAARSQALYPVSFEEKFSGATLITEGKVLSQYAFRDPANAMIYTASRLQLGKVFAGNVQDSTVEILTIGGVVDNYGVHASELLTLSVGEAGVFFLYPNSIGLKAPRSGALLYDVYSSAQGALKYDAFRRSAGAPFVRYEDIRNDLFPLLEALAGHTYRQLSDLTSAGLHTANKTTGGITSFSPAHVHAGAHLDAANNTLTITGNGFGTPSGTAAVLFDNPDDGPGGTTPTTVLYSSTLIGAANWTGTQITVKVPEKAGTGVIQVRDSSGAIVATSSANLVVDYSVMTADFGSGPEEINLMNANSLGGYSIVYSTATAGSGINLNGTPEQAAFQRALTTHKEAIGFNVTENGTTTTQAVSASDGLNVVQFDNSNTGVAIVPSGVLALCYSYFGKCSPASSGAQRTGFDILIRNNAVSGGGSATTFSAGPCPPAPSSYANIDLETVMLHELGHAENQDHVIEPNTGPGLPQVNPAAVMNYIISNGGKRASPDLPLLTCGLYEVTPSNLTYGNCGLPTAEMIPLTTTVAQRDECSAVSLATVAPSNNSIAFDLAHATSNRNTDPQTTAFNVSSTTVSLTNTQYYGFKTDPTGGNLSITVSGYNTTPSTQAACTGAGVEIALYQVSSCPAGGSYPAPAAYRTFNANGILASINGLAANTSYLLVADGIENTKATFNLSFGGTALPLQVLHFDGRAQGGANVLSWAINKHGLTRIELGRSLDGKSFTTIAAFTGNDAAAKETYYDADFAAGNNFYRLVAYDQNDTKAYSGIVLLMRSLPGAQVSLAPNPANADVLLRYSSVSASDILINIKDAAGAVVYRNNFPASAGMNTWTLPISGLAAGYYMVVLQNSSTGVVETLKLLRN